MYKSTMIGLVPEHEPGMFVPEMPELDFPGRLARQLTFFTTFLNQCNLQITTTFRHLRLESRRFGA